MHASVFSMVYYRVQKQRNWIFKITKSSTRGQQEIRGLKWSAPLILWRLLFSFVSFYCYQYLVCFAFLLFFVLPCSCFLLSGSDRKNQEVLLWHSTVTVWVLRGKKRSSLYFICVKLSQLMFSASIQILVVNWCFWC